MYKEKCPYCGKVFEHEDSRRAKGSLNLHLARAKKCSQKFKIDKGEEEQEQEQGKKGNCKHDFRPLDFRNLQEQKAYSFGYAVVCEKCGELE